MTTIRVVFARGHVLVTEFRGMALNGIFCAGVLQPLDLVHLADFTYKYHPADTETRAKQLETSTYTGLKVGPGRRGRRPGTL